MNLDDIPEASRELMDGEGTDPLTFTAWMNDRTAAEQAEMFGADRARLWRAGQITQAELLAQTGRRLAPGDLR